MHDSSPSTRRRPIIRVFVSSTFTDLKHERDALQRHVFPRLERLCAARRFQFQAIDLRWGISAEAGWDHRTMRICFEELRRSQEISPQPNFLILLGNRYGWRPLPEGIDKDEYQELVKAAEGDPTALRLLERWYPLDENARRNRDEEPRIHVLRSRKPDYTEPEDWEPVQRTLWNLINHAFPASGMRDRFKQPRTPEQPLPSIVRFQASATEQEIWRGALAVPNARDHVLAFFRTIDNLDAYPADQIAPFIDVVGHERDKGLNTAIEELKAELRSRLGDASAIDLEPHAHLKRVTDEKGSPVLGPDGQQPIDVTENHITELCDGVYTRLETIVTRQMDEYWGTTGEDVPPAKLLQLERDEHTRFAKERAPADAFVGRHDQLGRIMSYLTNDVRLPLVVHGESGCGKTALMARAAQDAERAGHKLIVRFIGWQPRSSDLRSLLSSLCEELRQGHAIEGPLPGDLNELIKEFRGHLDAATADNRIVLFLDALDQLPDADNAASLYWLPAGPLPEHVKIIVSCVSGRPGEPAGRSYEALERRRLPDPQYLDLASLPPVDAQALLFKKWLPQAGRTLTEDQERAVLQRLETDACRDPLYLRVLFEEARQWRSWDRPLPLGKDVRSLLGDVFDRLGDRANHGATFRCAMAYIASAKRGLTENEVLETLFQDKPYMRWLRRAARQPLPDDPPRIPIAIWSRVRFDLSPYLAEQGAPGGTVLNFYHRQVAEFVRDRFLRLEGERRKRHRRLAAYFAGQDYWFESLEDQRARSRRFPPTPRPANVRKVDELPAHRLAAEELDAVEALFTNLAFLEAKAEVGMVFDLVTEFTDAVRTLPRERPKHRILRLLDEAVRRDIHFIARHPTTLFQCLWNSCWWYDCQEASKHYDPPEGSWSSDGPPWDRPEPKLSTMMEGWHLAKKNAALGFIWVAALRPPPVPLGGNQQVVLRGHEDGMNSAAFSPDGARVVTASRDKTARVWDATSGRELAVLRGHEGPVWSAAFSPDGALVLTGSHDNPADCTARVWDASSGRELAVLRGHEDGVNSAAFSPDGARVVTASWDKTARVWDATSGRELAVLRGHEYGVNSAAFSPDGARMVTASWDKTARVWDATSGRELAVLRGHKDGVNSAAFSPDGARVVTGGLHDRTARVWDAGTGNCIEVIRGRRGEVQSIAEGAGRFPLRAMAEALETRIERQADRAPIAWYAASLSNIATHAGGRMWAGGTANHFHLITLEGDIQSGADDRMRASDDTCVPSSRRRSERSPA